MANTLVRKRFKKYNLILLKKLQKINKFFLESNSSNKNIILQISFQEE